MSKTFFETIKAVDGEIFHLSFHQKRYESVLKHFGIKEIQNLSLHVNPPKNTLYRCRLTYDLSINPHKIEVEYYEYQKREISSLKLVYDDRIVYDLKSTNRERLEELYELRESCDDILVVKNSLITDTTIANIAFYDSKNWLTPAKPLLKGTTRDRLLSENKIYEADIHVKDLKNFSHVALMNAMIDFDIITKNNKEFFC
ncbi:putative para-aminobenzoate synthase component I [Sulfurimonas denitrificans DSM 1251]|uniref:Putative para-aminobenzoate synthase component I n=1 Tax=Sulfurimonas denitrificans (strain ATCC 33889 / DSM 1251) TaxID=326298 RepID=Q30TG6_SULDN|nr:aminotransferase class IV family protein [Sulfurimonas denitrificans]ABB43715.1 putative para-aminobenzoate synthase component I [Sulfurimonas denitrificans DSM 1251]MDD3442738.1 aminotransferase class IV family protein [Sulfurimonas denitrificans]